MDGAECRTPAQRVSWICRDRRRRQIAHLMSSATFVLHSPTIVMWRMGHYPPELSRCWSPDYERHRTASPGFRRCRGPSTGTDRSARLQRAEDLELLLAVQDARDVRAEAERGGSGRSSRNVTEKWRRDQVAPLGGGADAIVEIERVRGPSARTRDLAAPDRRFGVGRVLRRSAVSDLIVTIRAFFIARRGTSMSGTI
jgi:hypothetical protein